VSGKKLDVIRPRASYHSAWMYRSGTFFVGLAALVVAACSANGDSASAPEKPPPTECVMLEDCPGGTTACVNGFCVSGGGCIDKDNDQAGIGPLCDMFDCDDNDPSVPAGEICGNSEDEDCDGVPDNGCPCVDENSNPLPDGSTKPCGSGECAGTVKCELGVWGSTCDGGKVPSPSEVCGNAVDENCNGEKDEGCCPAGESPCPGVAVCSSNSICN
jgi:hypothetical protein